MKRIQDLPDADLRVFEHPPIPEASRIKTIYLIGICGTGMGSLAGLLQQAGYQVQGSDEAAYPPMSTRLREMDVVIHEHYDTANLDPAPDLVVVGNACTPRHPEAAYARERGIPQLSLPEALAHFFLDHRRSLVVAGTHGKTTTTGMLVHVLQSAGLDPGFLVGGIMVDGNVSYGIGSGRHFVVEGDEYDSAYWDKQPKFMHYRPSSAIVTSMEFDHADIYDDWVDYQSAFRDFARTMKPGSLLTLFGDDAGVRRLREYTEARVCYYGIDGGDDHYTARDVRPVAGGQEFTLVREQETLARIFLPMSGRHNLRNALAVCSMALDEGVTPDQLARGFATFKGMKRRQEVRGEAAGVLVIDDFAHHPTAVEETCRAVAERWPDRRLVAVFEPRSNSSRRKVFEQAYAEAFDAAAAVFISAPPLRHNDSAETLLDAVALVRNINERGIAARGFDNAADLLLPLAGELRSGDVVLVMSNGGFDGIHQKLLDLLQKRA